MRLMTWNCLGMADGSKQTKLLSYAASQRLDLVLLQEGAPAFTRPGWTITAIGEETTTFTSYLATDGRDLGTALSLLFPSNGALNTTMISPAGGVGRSANYNVIAPALAPAKIVDDSAACDYLGVTASRSLREWVVSPLSDRLNRRVGIKSNEAEISLEKGRSRVGFKGAGNKDVRAALAEIKAKITKRVSLCAYRRPKLVQAGGFDIYHWHAPLGSETSLKELGIKGLDTVRGEGCGGEAAVAANHAFATWLLNGGTDFPAGTLLVGDLNLKRAGVEHIYKTKNVVSSHDGWCHVVAATGTPLRSLVTTLDQAQLGYSDHSPIIVEV